MIDGKSIRCALIICFMHPQIFFSCSEITYASKVLIDFDRFSIPDAIPICWLETEGLLISVLQCVLCCNFSCRMKRNREDNGWSHCIRIESMMFESCLLLVKLEISIENILGVSSISWLRCGSIRLNGGGWRERVCGR